jgi:hypothetical protein
VPSPRRLTGWQRRVITDPARASELSELYRSAGFEVRIVPAIPEDFVDSCAPCPLVRTGAFHVVYTRRLAGDHQ